MSEKADLYTYHQIHQLNLDDEEILKLLKASWGYSQGETMMVCGQIKKISYSDVVFYVISPIYHLHTGEELHYPVSDEVRHNIFVPASLENFARGSWVQAEVCLAELKEREKHNNPFELNATKLTPLQLLPFSDIEVTKQADRVFIEKRIYEFFLQKGRQKIEIQLKEQEEALQSLNDDVLSKKQEKDELNQEVVNIKKSLQQQSDEYNTKIQQMDLSEQEHRQTLRDLEQQISETKYNFQRQLLQYQDEMESKMAKLSQFIEQKAKMLKDLDLIDEESYEKFVPSSIDMQSERCGHDFHDVFNGDIKQAIAYIQSYLYQKGIFYKKDVLEDFYALLQTHDLIVLAGDSGSGKTNLVKSFAEAIGGKSFVVPVKPNWTSAEDLLGYYNPLEQKYISTLFLEAMFEAQQHPDVMHFICLDEMNLARVEYYFADFLSLMESRKSMPNIRLYSESESSNVLNEVKVFLSLIDESLVDSKHDIKGFVELLTNKEVSEKLNELCGFKEGDSLLKYHAYLRRVLSSYLNIPASLSLPPNIRIIGAINIDETTHYLSPKILDRAHIVRFYNPLLIDWREIKGEIGDFEIDNELPVLLSVEDFKERVEYPSLDVDDKFVRMLIELAVRYLNPIGIEFGLRTIRQAQNYVAIMQSLEWSDELIMNQIILHKVLPKLVFDGDKQISGQRKLDILKNMRDFIVEGISDNMTSVAELDQLIRNAQDNDFIVNYWIR